MKGNLLIILIFLQLSVSFFHPAAAHADTGNKAGGLEKIIEFYPARPIEKWQVISSSAGLPLLVSFIDTVPYIHGIKVRMQLGNPTSISYLGFRVHAQWGQSPEVFVGNSNQWNASLKSLVIEFDNKLLPGSKNKLSLFLPRTKPEEFGYLRFFITINDIYLKTQ